MTKGQEWADAWHDSSATISLPNFLDRKIEELRDEYQKAVLKAWNAGYEFCEHLDKVFGGSK
jgi:hypothetical protein